MQTCTVRMYWLVNGVGMAADGAWVGMEVGTEDGVVVPVVATEMGMVVLIAALEVQAVKERLAVQTLLARETPMRQTSSSSNSKAAEMVQASCKSSKRSPSRAACRSRGRMLDQLHSSINSSSRSNSLASSSSSHAGSSSSHDSRSRSLPTPRLPPQPCRKQWRALHHGRGRSSRQTWPLLLSETLVLGSGASEGITYSEVQKLYDQAVTSKFVLQAFHPGL